MKSVIDFIVDVAKDKKLGEDFHTQVQNSDHSKLSAWFQGKGYDVKADEAKKLVDNKGTIKASTVGIY